MDENSSDSGVYIRGGNVIYRDIEATAVKTSRSVVFLEYFFEK